MHAFVSTLGLDLRILVESGASIEETIKEAHYGQHQKS